MLHCVFTLKQSSFWLCAATDIWLSAFYSALLNFLSQQGFRTYVRPLRILQLILRRFWVTSFPIRTGSRDSACLPSSGPVRGPHRWLQSATKLLRKLKSYVSAFSLSNWVCLDFTFKAACVFSFISLWEIVCPLYQFMNVWCVKLKWGALQQPASQAFFSPYTRDRISDAKINHQINI